MNEAIAVVLRALAGEPLRDEKVRSMVVAAARALAEREGVELVAVDADPDRVTLLLRTDRIVALGFAAELRRGTDAWYRGRHNATLWGDPPAEERWPEEEHAPDPDDESDSEFDYRGDEDDAESDEIGRDGQ